MSQSQPGQAAAQVGQRTARVSRSQALKRERDEVAEFRAVVAPPGRAAQVLGVEQLAAAPFVEQLEARLGAGAARAEVPDVRLGGQYHLEAGRARAQAQIDIFVVHEEALVEAAD